MGLDRYLDASDLQQETTLEIGYNYHINKICLRGGKAMIHRGVRFILNAFGERCAALCL